MAAMGDSQVSMGERGLPYVVAGDTKHARIAAGPDFI
jgi:hypothetical protein